MATYWKRSLVTHEGRRVWATEIASGNGFYLNTSDALSIAVVYQIASGSI